MRGTDLRAEMETWPGGVTRAVLKMCREVGERGHTGAAVALALAAGRSPMHSAADLGISLPAVSYWIARFRRLGVEDALRASRGRPRGVENRWVHIDLEALDRGDPRAVPAACRAAAAVLKRALRRPANEWAPRPAALSAMLDDATELLSAVTEVLHALVPTLELDTFVAGSLRRVQRYGERLSRLGI